MAMVSVHVFGLNEKGAKLLIKAGGNRVKVVAMKANGGGGAGFEVIRSRR
jgi:hypothetical protein